MTPAARLAAAIDVLDSLPRHSGRADQALKAWGRANRYAGSKDRAAIADQVYLCLRRRRSLAWRAQSDDGRGLVLASVAAEVGVDGATELFGSSKFAPPALSAAEQATLTRPGASPESAPLMVRLDWPDWLADQITARFGADLEQNLTILQGRAPLDLRVNTLKTDVKAAQAALDSEGIETTETPLSPWGLRAPEGAKIIRTQAYTDGWVEVQDCASQAAAAASGVRPDDHVLDYCAGGGGKTLALAAMVGPKGSVAAYDVNPARMTDLPERLRRAGATAVARIVDAHTLQRRAPFDAVFVDAPCSGSGAWRRNPDEKWRLTPQRLAALGQAQAEAIRAGADFTRPGGALIYATCSVLPCENHAVVEAFLQDAPEFRCDVAQAFAPADGGDGFFVARLINKSK